MRSLLLIPVLALAACGSSDQSPIDEGEIEAMAEDEIEESTDGLSFDVDGAGVSSDLSGDVVDVVTTRDGALEIGVTDEVLFSRLSEATRAEIEAEMASETKDQEGLGGTIARAVTGAVAQGLATTVSVPLADVRDVRYEDGRLVIEMVDGGESPFDNAETNDRPMLTQFDEAAARRLAEAFDKATR